MNNEDIVENTEYSNYNKMLEKLKITPEDRTILCNLVNTEKDQNIKNAINEFCGYLFETNSFEKEIDGNSRSKIIHSLKTVIIQQKLSKNFKLNDKDTRTSLIIALLHDIGRFDQIREYTGDGQYYVGGGHPQKGANLLFSSDKLIRRFILDDSDDEIIKKAILYHGDKNLPQIDDKRMLMFCDMIRDSDIAENIMHKSRYSREELMRNLAIKDPTELSQIGKQEISEKVLESALNCRTVNNEDRNTKIDFVVGYLCLVYGIQYVETFKIMEQDGAISRLYNLISYEGITKKCMEMIKQKIESYIKNKKIEKERG